MKRIIFTVYDDSIICDNIKQIASKNSIKEYYDRLIENKKEYAKIIDVDFLFVDKTSKKITEMFKHFDHDVQFTDVNLYKHVIMDQLAEEYDEIMYVDMDVVFNTTDNIFDCIDLSKGIAIKTQNEDIRFKEVEKVIFAEMNERNPTLKYHITKDLLDGGDNNVINTGVIIGRSEHIKSIKLLEKLPKIIEMLNEKRNQVIDDNKKYVWIRQHYYPNNEAIFSYILEKDKIPYQLLDDEWHDIRNCKALDTSYGKIIHFINKQFHQYFNDKTKVVYSLYIKIEDDKLDDAGFYDGDDIPKSKRTQMKLEHYYDDLLQNKIKYAESIGADFILYENDEEYQDFAKKYSFMSEYNIINLYKIYVLEKLTNEYDQVLYIDFDVYCRKNIDIFNILDADHYMLCAYNDKEDLKIENTAEYFNKYKHCMRSPHTKYWNAHALLNEYDIDGDNVVFNTGIIATTKKIMDKLKFFDDIDEILNLMESLKKDSMYPSKIQSVFGYDNETIFSFKVAYNNIPHINLNGVFHYKHISKHVEYSSKQDVKSLVRKMEFDSEMRVEDPIFIHFISKQFELVFDNVNKT